jgi:anthranilate synthase component I
MGGLDQLAAIPKRSTLVPVIETMPADLLTPLAVYLKLSETEPNSFLLESVEGGETLARYSFIGAGPYAIIRGNESFVIVRDAQGERRVEIPLFQYLRETFARHSVESDNNLPSFVGGAIGYFGFGCAEWFEPTLKNLRSPSEDDDARFMQFSSVVAFDHAKQVIKIVTLVRPRDDEKGHQGALDEAVLRNRSIRSVLEVGNTRVPPNGEFSSLSDVTSNWTRPAFEGSVRQIKELIRAGECYQVVLSQRFSKKTNALPVAIYRALRSLNPSPYMFLLKFDDKSIIGASPEMLVRSRGRDLEYRPIAGTRPRGKTAEEDLALAEEMRTDKKEVAEHLMLVDLGRNDLGRVSEFGSINVASLMNVEKYSHVQHLVSSITSKLREGMDRFDALAACFPAGTVSGAPKVRAIEIISELEPTSRGVYAGAVGYFDYAGNMDTCIAIRTLALENGVAHVQAGAGIVADSVPESEFEETVNKAKALLRTIEIAEGGGF